MHTIRRIALRILGYSTTVHPDGTAYVRIGDAWMPID